MSKEKILIVEDDLDQLKGLGMRLNMNGYDVVSAQDAVAAISVARKETPNLIILDIGLPAGDGFVIMQRLKDLMLSSIPVIVLSGRDPWLNEEKALEAGAVEFFQKPADNDELLAAISNALGSNLKTA